MNEINPPTPWFKRKRFVIPAAVLGLALIVACGSTGKDDGKPIKPAAVATTKAAAPTQPADPPAPTYGTPTKADFRVNVKVTSKQCFGSAGCNVHVKTTLTNATGIKLDPAVTYELTYQILGDESGPITDTMEITGDEYTGSGEKFLSTRSSATKVTARIISVDEG